MLAGRKHVERYEATGGREGHDWQGAEVLILTTTGRRSGERRRTPLIYARSGDDYLVVASNGGEDRPPAWYLNLRANPEAAIQVRADRFAVRARDATPKEKPELWRRVIDVWPAYDEYQAKTARPIPVVVLSAGSPRRRPAARSR